MKVFLIDKNKDHLNFKNNLENNISIEVKNNCKIKTTKSDYVIFFEKDILDEDLKDIQRFSKTILITNNEDTKKIWDYVTKYNCIDIIKENLNEDYIVNRILKIVKL